MKCMVKFTVGAILCMSLTTAVAAKAICFSCRQDADSLRQFLVTLGGQSNPDVGGVLDLSEGQVRRLADGRKKQKSVDMLYAYGPKTGANLLAPSSSRLRYFGGSLYKMSYRWSDFSKGYFIDLKHSKKAAQLYAETQTLQELIQAYNDVLRMRKVKTGRTGLNALEMSIPHIEPGDIIIFGSYDKPGLYAIAKVVDYTSGYEGTLTLDFKVSIR